MGGSASGPLDDSKCTYIRGKTEATLRNFSPHYRRQHAAAFCRHAQEELEQRRDAHPRFLRARPPEQPGAVLYEAELLHFAEDLRKWKDRYVVIKADYTVHCFESREAYQKGASPKHHIVPAGGKVLTSEEDYNLLSDKHFPDPVGLSEKEAAPALVQLPREQFPVFLWQPFARHSYYCCPEPAAQRRLSTILGDCVRHCSHDFLKQTTYEVEAFLEAIQFFRQEKGHYGTWEMITGKEKEILSNLVMEELLPNLQTMILPKMKGKRNDRKRAWFAIVEETYGLVQQQVAEGLSTLKEECREFAKTLEGTIRSDMDQILNSKNFLAGKIKAAVSEPAQRCCTENIQPFLPSILEELMGPVSSGFAQVRSLFEKEVNELIQDFQKTNDMTKLKENVDQLMNLPFNSVKMEPCYLKVNLLQELLQDLKSRFKVYHIDFVIQRTQNFMQELMENAVYTFEQLFSPSLQADSAKVATTMEKVKLRVLKQYDYDSSTVRKKIFQEALVQITLPTLQRSLASTCKPELQKYEQYIFADHTSVIQVENVYEEILYQTLLEEALKVIKEAATLKKHNLFEDNLTLGCESVSSLAELRSPSGSAQPSPARTAGAARAEGSDTEGQGSDALVGPGRIAWDRDAEQGKAAGTEASGRAAGGQASTREAVGREKQEPPSAARAQQGGTEGKSAWEKEPQCAVNTERQLKAQQGAGEEEGASETDTAVRNFGASPKKEPEGAVEEKATSESKMATDAAFVGGTEKESKAREEAAEIKLTAPHGSATEAEIPGNVEKKNWIEKEIMEKLSQSENVVGTGFEEDSKKASSEQGASTETRVVSQQHNTGTGGFGNGPEKESKSEKKSCKSPDDVNEIRNLLLVAVEIPADTAGENIKEICEGEILKLQEDNRESSELSKVAVAGIEVSQRRSEDAAERAEFKEQRPPSYSLGTAGANLESLSKGARAEWLVESSEPPQEAEAKGEMKQSGWYTGVGGSGGEGAQPEGHTGEAGGAGNGRAIPVGAGGAGGAGHGHAIAVGAGGAGNGHAIPEEGAGAGHGHAIPEEGVGAGHGRAIPEEGVGAGNGCAIPEEGAGAGHGHAIPGEAEPQSCSQGPAADADTAQVPILDTANPGTVSLVPQQHEGSDFSEVTGDIEAGGAQGEPEHESSSHTEIRSPEVKDILTEETREDGCVQPNSQE